jgi:putative DNA primase/helicase
MSDRLEIAVGKPDRYGKRMVAVVNGVGTHRDTFDTDNAFQRSKWRDAVTTRFSLGDEAHEWLEGELLEKADAADDESAPARKLIGRTFDNVKAAKVTWLLEGRIPLGALTVIDGDPGSGKSQVSIDIAARGSRGDAMPPFSAPDGTHERFASLLLYQEDGAEDTVRPRLDAAGAVPSMVHEIRRVETHLGHNDVLVLPTDTAQLREYILKHRIKFVVIDPLEAFVEQGINTNSNTDMRRMLTPLAEVARETQCAILIVRHMAKQTGRSALHRGAGTIGITAAARAGYIVAPDPDNPEVRVMACHKLNLTKRPASLAFRIESAGDASKIVWDGEVEITADELAGSGDKKPGDKIEAAKKIIVDILSSGSRGSNEVETACTDAGISKATYWRARKDIGVRAEKTEFGGQWLLSLPASEDPQPYEEFQ